MGPIFDIHYLAIRATSKNNFPELFHGQEHGLVAVLNLDYLFLALVILGHVHLWAFGLWKI